MQNLFQQVTELIKQDDRIFTSEGVLLRNKLQELVYGLDDKLISMLLSDNQIKEKFFKEVKGIALFDQKKFIQLINNKQFLPDSYTSFKNKIGLVNSDDEYISGSNDVVLNRPYKDCILAGGQDKEDAKRNEVFYNEILGSDQIDRLLDPKVFTNFKKYNTEGESEISSFTRDENGVIKDNLIIKGNNLLALHSLKKEFVGRVKLIYIDPPYNPESVANTFAYNNKFNHSTRLTFIKNRAEISKDLLSDDGFYCIAIDHYELFYLGVLVDEIFGRDNRVGIIAVETNPGGRTDSKFFATSHEYFLVYAKSINNAEINGLLLDENDLKKYKFEDEYGKYGLLPLQRGGSNSTPKERPNLYFSIYVNPDDLSIHLEKGNNYFELLPIDTDGNNRVWRRSKDKILGSMDDLMIKKSDKGYSIFTKDRIKDVKKPKTFRSDSKYSSVSHGTMVLKSMKLDGAFSYPKSLYLMKDVIRVLTNKDDIILDYHAGSGTTAHAVLELNKEDGGNRQFIMCEQMDYINTVTVPRVHQVIKNNNQGDFVYMEIMKHNQILLEEIDSTQTKDELIQIYHTIKDSSFINYNVDISSIDKNITDFGELSLDDMKCFLHELIDKNTLYTNLSDINDLSCNVSDEDKKLNADFYK